MGWEMEVGRPGFEFVYSRLEGWLYDKYGSDKEKYIDKLEGVKEAKDYLEYIEDVFGLDVAEKIWREWVELNIWKFARKLFNGNVADVLISKDVFSERGGEVRVVLFNGRDSVFWCVVESDIVLIEEVD